jgi:putative sporulation protein YtaF
LAFLAGTFLKNYLSSQLIIFIAFSILFIVGAAKLIDSITRSIIKRHKNIKKEITFSLFNFNFTLKLQPNPDVLDKETASTITPVEAAVLAISLSLDGMAVGFGASLVNVNGVAVFLWSLLTNAIAVLLGCHMGNRLVQKVGFNLSWLSGFVLIGLAFSKFF